MSKKQIISKLKINFSGIRINSKSAQSQKGQAVIELALMMVFLAAILLGIVIVAEFTSKNVSALESIRHEMRVSMADKSAGTFSFNTANQTVTVNIPGRMSRLFGTPVISQEHNLYFYEGSYHGLGNSEYRKKTLQRKILENIR